jgi:hypothetical protein
MAATMMANLNALVRSTSVRDIKDLNLIPPLAFVKKEPRMLEDYRTSAGGRGGRKGFKEKPGGG